MLLRLAGAAVPIRSCSRWGLPCRPCCQGRGALLPPRFALARGLPYGACTGGLFSVALSLGSPPPDVIRHRIPVEPGLSSTALRRQRPSGRLTCGQMAAVLGGRQAGYVPCLASEISIGAAHTTVGVHPSLACSNKFTQSLVDGDAALNSSRNFVRCMWRRS